MADPKIERVAQALWDHTQSTLPGRFWNDITFGQEWNGKVVPWSHVVAPPDAMHIAERYRGMARAAIGAMDG